MAWRWRRKAKLWRGGEAKLKKRHHQSAWRRQEAVFNEASGGWQWH